MQTIAAARPTGAVRAGIVTMAGGLVMILGTLLPFLQVSAGLSGLPTQSASGLDTPDGKLFLWFGAAIAVFGLVILLTRGVLPKVMGVLAVLAGGIMAVAGIVDLTGLGEEGLRAIADATAEQTPGVTSDQVIQLLRQVGVSVDAGIGLYVTLAGTAISVIGGVWAIFTRTTAPTVPAPPPPPGLGTTRTPQAPDWGTAPPPPAPGEPPPGPPRG